jgi:hypothetical protein
MGTISHGMAWHGMACSFFQHALHADSMPGCLHPSAKHAQSASAVSSLPQDLSCSRATQMTGETGHTSRRRSSQIVHRNRLPRSLSEIPASLLAGSVLHRIAYTSVGSNGAHRRRERVPRPAHRPIAHGRSHRFAVQRAQAFPKPATLSMLTQQRLGAARRIQQHSENKNAIHPRRRPFAHVTTDNVCYIDSGKGALATARSGSSGPRRSCRFPQKTSVSALEVWDHHGGCVLTAGRPCGP